MPAIRRLRQAHSKVKARVNLYRKTLSQKIKILIRNKMISFKRNLGMFIFQNFYEIRLIFYRSNIMKLKWKLFAFLCMLILFLFFCWLGRRAFRKIHGLLRYCFSKRRIIGGRQLNFTKDIINSLREDDYHRSSWNALAILRKDSYL